MVNKKNHKIYFGFFNKILSTSKISHKSIRRSEIKYAKSELSVTGNMHFIIKASEKLRYTQSFNTL